MGRHPENFKDNIISAVRFHNKKTLPSDLKLGEYKWSCLVRDADKIDIYRMVQERLDNGTIYEMLPRHRMSEGLSPELVEEIRKTGTGSYSNARSLLDYRLIQLTWGCDLNFPVSVVTLREEGIIERMCGDLRPCGIDDRSTASSAGYTRWHKRGDFRLSGSLLNTTTYPELV